MCSSISIQYTYSKISINGSHWDFCTNCSDDIDCWLRTYVTRLLTFESLSVILCCVFIQTSKPELHNLKVFSSRDDLLLRRPRCSSFITHTSTLFCHFVKFFFFTMPPSSVEASQSRRPSSVHASRVHTYRTHTTPVTRSARHAQFFPPFLSFFLLLFSFFSPELLQ